MKQINIGATMVIGAPELTESDVQTSDDFAQIDKSYRQTGNESSQGSERNELKKIVVQLLMSEFDRETIKVAIDKNYPHVIESYLKKQKEDYESHDKKTDKKKTALINMVLLEKILEQFGSR